MPNTNRRIYMYIYIYVLLFIYSHMTIVDGILYWL